jgi:hypothetical protein
VLHIEDEFIRGNQMFGFLQEFVDERMAYLHQLEIDLWYCIRNSSPDVSCEIHWVAVPRTKLFNQVCHVIAYDDRH